MRSSQNSFFTILAGTHTQNLIYLYVLMYEHSENVIYGIIYVNSVIIGIKFH